MSGRCKSCNAFLEEWEMKTIDPLTNTYTELCDICSQDTLYDDLDLWDTSLNDEDHIYSES